MAMPSMVPAIYSQSPSGAAYTAPAQPSSGGHFSFHDLLDIVNPLQHLPVIGTLYRAITGDKIGGFEKVAGDTLYGGIWGAVSSVADLAFEAVTGKDFGDTVLAMVTGHHDAAKPVAVAQNSAAPSVTATPDTMAANASTAAAATPDIDALTSALMQKGFDSDMTQRALFAYRKSSTLTGGMGLTGSTLAGG
jgi:hypothetical protein